MLPLPFWSGNAFRLQILLWYISITLYICSTVYKFCFLTLCFSFAKLDFCTYLKIHAPHLFLLVLWDLKCWMWKFKFASMEYPKLWLMAWKICTTCQNSRQRFNKNEKVAVWVNPIQRKQNMMWSNFCWCCIIELSLTYFAVLQNLHGQKAKALVSKHFSSPRKPVFPFLFIAFHLLDTA